MLRDSRDNGDSEALKLLGNVEDINDRANKALGYLCIQLSYDC